jgi:hypothetical protein
MRRSHLNSQLTQSYTKLRHVEGHSWNAMDCDAEQTTTRVQDFLTRHGLDDQHHLYPYAARLAVASDGPKPSSSAESIAGP